MVIFSYSGHTKEILLAISILKVFDNEHLLRVGTLSSLYSSMKVENILYLGIIQHEIEDNIESKMIATKNIINPLKDLNP